MTPIETIVLIGSIITSLVILYYFFGPKGGVASAQTNTHHQRLTVVVDSGYSPSQLQLKANLPAEIIFDRRDHGECTDWVIFDRFPTKEGKEVKSYLPVGQKTTISFTPTTPGSYGFACGMGMNKGKLIINA